MQSPQGRHETDMFKEQEGQCVQGARRASRRRKRCQEAGEEGGLVAASGEGVRQRDSMIPRVVSKLILAAGSGMYWRHWRGTRKPQSPGEMGGRVDKRWKYF